MKQLVSALLVFTGCSAAVEMSGDDEAGGGGINGDRAAHFTSTTIHDERFDQIDYASGEPVHSHAGPAITLGGADCVDVFKHSYLLETPKFGGEASSNPIAFAVVADEYRVRRDTAVIADWLPVTRGTITIGRATLGDREGTYYVDVRAGGAQATACWNHHPLAAPIDVQPAKHATPGLADMSLLLDAPISRLLAPATAVPVYTQELVNRTAEPVTMTVDVTPPGASFTRRAVEDYVVSATGTTNVICEDANGNASSEPICTQPNQMPIAQVSLRSGALASGTWSLAIVDLATGGPASTCTITNLHATCEVPPRAAAAPPAYRMILSIENVADLAPATSGPYAEHAIAGLTFTGKQLEVARRCTDLRSITKFGATILTCLAYVDYTHIQALDSAQIMFATTPITINGASHEAPAYLWDAGDDDLPGAS